MGLFDFLRAEPQIHPRLGRIERAAGHWHGRMALAGAGPVLLHLPGSRQGPDPAAIAAAEEAPVLWQQARDAVARELFEHYSNGRDGGLPEIAGLTGAAVVWRHVELSSVEMIRHKETWGFQVALRTQWDEEHTLGARIGPEGLRELNGSILEPR